MFRRLFKFIAAAAVSIGVLGCSSAGGSTAPSSAASGTAMPEISGSGMPMGSDAMTEVGSLGQPADAATADRTIHINASDQLKFDPDAAQVKVGETVTFEIENTGKTDHEFVLGSPAYQAAHEQEMPAGHMDMADESNAVDLPAGTTKSVTWQFTEAARRNSGAMSRATSRSGWSATSPCASSAGCSSPPGTCAS